MTRSRWMSMVVMLMAVFLPAGRALARPHSKRPLELSVGAGFEHGAEEDGLVSQATLRREVGPHDALGVSGALAPRAHTLGWDVAVGWDHHFGRGRVHPHGGLELGFASGELHAGFARVEGGVTVDLWSDVFLGVGADWALRTDAERPVRAGLELGLRF